MQDVTTGSPPPEGTQPRARQYAESNRPKSSVHQLVDSALANAPQAAHLRFSPAIKYLLPWN
jgi:hypothetical protein